MINFFLEILCSFLIAMSLVFIVIQIRARFDKSFLIFGIANLLLCSFSAIDIWLQHESMVVHWTRIQHIVASFFPPFILWYILLSVHRENLNLIRWKFIAATLVSLTFFSNLMLVQVGNEVTGTTLYNFIFAPYIVLSIIEILLISAKILRRGTKIHRHFLLLHLVGIMILSASGVADLFCVLNGVRYISIIPSFTIIGILFFSCVVTTLFIEKLVAVILEREETFKKLRNAYQELEEVHALKELGQSAAMINHEIRNYSAAISGYAEILLMKGELNEFAQKIAHRIVESISIMSNFSKDILDFSKSSIIKGNNPVNLSIVIKNCIGHNFEKNAGKFILDYEDSGKFIINGDWHKLDQIFINIFKNSFEAKAEHVKVRLRQSKTTVRCQILDDGTGCNDQNIEHMFKAFQTTKKEIGGTGLGMCVVKSIVEGHGGKISAFSKQHSKEIIGFGLNIVFPVYRELKEKKEDEKNGIIFITEGIKNLSEALKIFRNALVNPHIVNDVREIDSDVNLKKKYAVVGLAESINQFKSRFKTETTLFVLVEEAHSGLFILDGLGEDKPVLFSEEYLLSQIVSREYELWSKATTQEASQKTGRM